MRVGIFDSGLGGINVLSCLLKKYPNNEYIFYGDTKNLPYGNKTKEELMRLSCSIIDFLLKKKVDIIIIACGTISSNCYKELKNKYTIPIYDIITPTIDYIKKSNMKNIGVIGTKKTIESNIFNIKDKNILMKSTPSFVPIIESNQIEKSKDLIIDELKPFISCDALVLGCTHYPLLKEVIDNNLHIKTIDMGECLLNNLLLTNNAKQSISLYFSKINDDLIKNVKKILKCDFKI